MLLGVIVASLASVASSQACQPQYVLGTDNSDTCPSNHGHIATVGECETAVAALAPGHSLTGNRDYGSDNPTGCFLNGRDGQYYFNTNGGGANSEGDKPICRRQTWMLSTENSNDCPAGHSKVTTFDDCQDAVEFLAPGTTVNGPGTYGDDNPAGCFFNGRDSQYYFNTEGGATNHEGDRPVCEVDSTVTLMQSNRGQKKVGGQRREARSQQNLYRAQALQKRRRFDHAARRTNEAKRRHSNFAQRRATVRETQGRLRKMRFAQNLSRFFGEMVHRMSGNKHQNMHRAQVKQRQRFQERRVEATVQAQKRHNHKAQKLTDV